MNIYDISKKAGVSIATVSRVLNNSVNVSEQTKEKVLRVIAESGYTPNAFARGLGLNSMQTVGILCADSSDSYFAQAISLIERGLRINGYNAILSCTGFSPEAKRKSLQLLLSKRVDGLVLIGSSFIERDDADNEYIRQAAAKVPVMLVNGVLVGPGIHSTLCDDYQAVKSAVETLLNEGKRHLLYLYNAHSYSGERKIEGFLAACRQRDIPIPKERLLFAESISGSVAGIVRQLTALREQGIKIDGVIASDDRLAIAALKFAKEHGLLIPDDLAIIGYNNADIAEFCDPELSSVDSRLEPICKHCVKTLLSVLEGKEMPQQTIFSAELVHRGTTSHRI